MTDQTAAPGRLPGFIVIGAMKSGTSSLRDYLRGHPEVYIPPDEELHYFAEAINWKQGVDWYRARFADAGDAIAVGEKSPTYTMHPEHPGVPERIHDLLPDVRLIYVVRHPIQRIKSHYVHQFGRGHEANPIRRAVREDPRYLDTTRYAMQLQRYLDHFPREQILIVTSEGLKFDRRATVQRVYDFLGVDSSHLPDVLATEFYQTARRRTYPPALLWARRLAKRHMLQGERAKVLVESMLARGTSEGRMPTAAGTPDAGEPSHVLAPGLQRRLADLLRDDVARFARHMPADFDGWGLT